MSMYTVWRDYEREEDGQEFEADSPRSAATKRADYDHAHRCAYEWSWPVTYHVADIHGAVFAVEVQRHVVPEFEAGPATFVRQEDPS